MSSTDGPGHRSRPGNVLTEIVFYDNGILVIYHIGRQVSETEVVGWGPWGVRERDFGTGPMVKGALNTVQTLRGLRAIAVSHLQFGQSVGLASVFLDFTWILNGDFFIFGKYCKSC
jgi:hypothetical protein